MALINDLSQQIPLAEFDAFSVPPTQTTVREDIISEHRPLNPIKSSLPIEFLINTGKDEYVNCREMLFYLKFHLELSKSDGTNVSMEDWKKIKISQNILHSMFENLDVSIGDTNINQSNSTYAYRSFFETLFNTGTDAKKSHLTASGYLDETKRNNLIYPDSVGVAESISRGKTVDLGGRLNFDLTFQDRALIGGCQLRIRLIPHNQSFYLQYSAADKLMINVVFEEASMEIHRSKVYEPILNAHEQALSIAPAKYPINRLDVKAFTLMKGTLDGFVDHAISGQLPRRIFVGFVSNEAFHGSITKDPFKFHHYNLNFMCCYLNGTQYPAKPYKPNFKQGSYIREFLSLYTSTNQILCEPKCSIDRYSFGDGLTLFAFNFSPDLSDSCNESGYVSLIKRGTLRLEMHFAEALPSTVNVLIFSEFDNIIEINKERNAITNFS